MSNREPMYDRRKDERVFSKTAMATHWWNISKWVPRGGRRM